MTRTERKAKMKAYRDDLYQRAIDAFEAKCINTQDWKSGLNAIDTVITFEAVVHPDKKSHIAATKTKVKNELSEKFGFKF